ncbi:MAG TPA: DoxX family protein [Acidimicrobiia bacterium]|nr:DoxX family protein [Acidimicrobiia bacterium]
MNPIDGGLLILRILVGLTIIAHGVNHGRNLEGTANWFARVGFRAAPMQARMSTVTELAAGTLLVLGLLTPFAAAAVIATMTVAAGSIHRFNGFFIFRKGEGWEYVNVLAWVSFVIAWTGGGEYSLDQVIGFDLGSTWNLLIGLGGFLAGIGQLMLFWRKPSAPVTAN